MKSRLSPPRYPWHPQPAAVGVFKMRGDGLQSFPLLGYRRFQFSDCRFPVGFVSPSRVGFSMTVTKIKRQRDQVISRSGRSGETAHRGFHQD